MIFFRVTLLSIFIICMCSTVEAQKMHEAIITLQDGNEIQCWAKLPSNKIFDNKLKYKESEKGKTLKIQQKDVKLLQVKTKQNIVHELEYTKLQFMIRKKGVIYRKDSKRATWQAVIFASDVIKAYYTADKYKINKQGTLVSISQGDQNTLATIKISYKRANETTPTFITEIIGGAITIGANKMFRVYAAEYFRNQDSEFAEYIENQKFKNSDYIQLCKIYSEYKEQ